MGKKTPAKKGAGGAPGPGADLWPLTRHGVQELASLFAEKKVLDAGVAEKILRAATALLSQLPTVIDVEVKGKSTVTVVGDTHGQVADVIDIFKKFGLPTRDRAYLFNGDYVDRGPQGCEVVLLLCAHMICDPATLHMLRGNHEDRQITTMYGFADEARRKYGNEMYNLFVGLFAALPLCGVINAKVVVMHGGLFREAYDPDTLAPMDSLRAITPQHRMDHDCVPEVGIMSDVLWSDPQPSERGDDGVPAGVSVTPNALRGSGCYFSDEAAVQWLDAHSFSLLVRSHEGPDLQPLDEGYALRADGRVATVFSARDYSERKNQGAVLTFARDCHPKVSQF
eukprot:TRINITY_DN33451_c0_g1_i1.p1 TRINITY_DN33451_c0_g1~~TRINITY_DN33451_c0_g1_i1.p1  ORF type:complete len:396 (+),score=109.16 TRINITY_DN33451_c0_g1_i1:172-1188(+)